MLFSLENSDKRPAVNMFICVRLTVFHLNIFTFLSVVRNKNSPNKTVRAMLIQP